MKKTNVAMKVLSKKTRPRVVHKFIILPACLLVGQLFQEIVTYKSEIVDNPYWRTGIIIGSFLTITIVGAFVVAPIAESVMKQIYTHSRRQGLLWEIVFLLAICAGVFFLYYMIYIDGVESVLPREWFNPVKVIQ